LYLHTILLKLPISRYRRHYGSKVNRSGHFIIFKIYGIHVVINYCPNQQMHENFITWRYVHNCHDKLTASSCLQMQYDVLFTFFFTPIDLWTIMAAVTCVAVIHISSRNEVFVHLLVRTIIYDYMYPVDFENNEMTVWIFIYGSSKNTIIVTQPCKYLESTVYKTS
jgi:hypothetical protein